MGFASLNGRLAEVDVKVPVYVCQDCYNFEHTNNTTINSLLMHSTERTKVAINICQLRQPEQPRGHTAAKVINCQLLHNTIMCRLLQLQGAIRIQLLPFLHPPFNRYMTMKKQHLSQQTVTCVCVCDKQRIPEICECEKFVDLLMHFRYNSCVILSEVIFCLMRIIITSVITGICGNIS